MAKKFKMDDDPFEGVLPHLKSTRKKKDVDTSNDDDESGSNVKSKSGGNGKSIGTSEITSTSDDKSDDKITGKITSTNTSKNKSTSASVNEIVNKSASKSISENENDDTFKSESAVNGASAVNYTSETESAGKSTITIARKSKGSALVKMTHYFRPDQLQAIDMLHEKSGRDKSELVRMAVDILIERAKVE